MEILTLLLLLLLLLRFCLLQICHKKIW